MKKRRKNGRKCATATLDSKRNLQLSFQLFIILKCCCWNLETFGRFNEFYLLCFALHRHLSASLSLWAGKKELNFAKRFHFMSVRWTGFCKHANFHSKRKMWSKLKIVFGKKSWGHVFWTPKMWTLCQRANAWCIYNSGFASLASLLFMTISSLFAFSSSEYLAVTLSIGPCSEWNGFVFRWT